MRPARFGNIFISDMIEHGFTIDVRGLEPPQPMVRILEKLASMPKGSVLKAHTDRRPVHLLDILNMRGFTATTEEQPDGSFITTIRC